MNTEDAKTEMIMGIGDEFADHLDSGTFAYDGRYLTAEEWIDAVAEQEARQLKQAIWEHLNDMLTDHRDNEDEDEDEDAA